VKTGVLVSVWVKKEKLRRTGRVLYMKATRDGLPKTIPVNRGNARGNVRPPAGRELSCHGAEDGCALRLYGKGGGSIAPRCTDRTRRLDCLLMDVERAYRK
jgi:hypothetical protein